MRWSKRVFYYSAFLYQLDYQWYFLIHLRSRLFLFFLFSAFFSNKRLKGFSEFHFPKKEQLEWKFAFHKERTWKDKICLIYFILTPFLSLHLLPFKVWWQAPNCGKNNFIWHWQKRGHWQYVIKTWLLTLLLDGYHLPSNHSLVEVTNKN